MPRVRIDSEAVNAKARVSNTREDAIVPEDQIERVLVVPTELFHRLGHFQGFCGEVDQYLDELLRPDHVLYRPRIRWKRTPASSN